MLEALRKFLFPTEEEKFANKCRQVVNCEHLSRSSFTCLTIREHFGLEWEDWWYEEILNYMAQYHPNVPTKARPMLPFHCIDWYRPELYRYEFIQYMRRKYG